MNIELCKACPHCATFDGNPAHIVFHCALAAPKRATEHGNAHVFDAANPTNIIGEDRETPIVDPSTKKRTFERVFTPKALFKIPHACPCKDSH